MKAFGSWEVVLLSMIADLWLCDGDARYRESERHDEDTREAS